MVYDVMSAKFHIEILMGDDFTGGRIFHFPIDFCMGLTTVQRKGAACDTFVRCHNYIYVTCFSNCDVWLQMKPNQDVSLTLDAG